MTEINEFLLTTLDDLVVVLAIRAGLLDAYYS